MCASLRSWAPPPFGRRPGEWVILVLPEAPTGALLRLPGDSLGVDSGAPGGTWARLPGDALGVHFGAPGGGWARLAEGKCWEKNAAGGQLNIMDVQIGDPGCPNW